MRFNSRNNNMKILLQFILWSICILLKLFIRVGCLVNSLIFAQNVRRIVEGLCGVRAPGIRGSRLRLLINILNKKFPLSVNSLGNFDGSFRKVICIDTKTIDFIRRKLLK